MQSVLRTRATVLPGNRLEISAPELRQGETVEVIVILPTVVPSGTQSAAEFLDSLPAGPRSYPSWEEFERRFQEERNSWDR